MRTHRNSNTETLEQKNLEIILEEFKPILHMSLLVMNRLSLTQPTIFIAPRGS